MDKRINCNNCPLCHVEVDTYCEQYCSDMADFIDETRAKAIDECTEAYFDVIEDVLHEKDLGISLNQALTIYARIMNKCNEKAEELKEQNNEDKK